MGALMFFQATAYHLPNRGDYPDGEDGEAQWQARLKSLATHPLNADRLHVLARRLNETVDDFVVHERDPRAGKETVRFIANGIESIATVLDNPDLQRLMARKARETDLSARPPRR
jgi:hypothetical protein